MGKGVFPLSRNDRLRSHVDAVRNTVDFETLLAQLCHCGIDSVSEARQHPHP